MDYRFRSPLSRRKLLLLILPHSVPTHEIVIPTVQLYLQLGWCVLPHLLEPQKSSVKPSPAIPTSQLGIQPCAKNCHFSRTEQMRRVESWWWLATFFTSSQLPGSSVQRPRAGQPAKACREIPHCPYLVTRKRSQTYFLRAAG